VWITHPESGKMKEEKFMILSDNEIRDITKLLEAGKPLPDEYRFKLFEE